MRALSEHTGLLGHEANTGTVMVDIDDTIVQVYGDAKQGASFGYSGVRGLNELLATVSTEQAAPVIAAQRLRQGSAGSPSRCCPAGHRHSGTDPPHPPPRP